jgi:ferredoxin
MKVTIDREECTMCSICWDTCPDFFEQSDVDELSQVVDDYRAEGDISKGEVPENLEDCVREAADGCPVDIIHLEE